jgi:hypothetical protein
MKINFVEIIFSYFAKMCIFLLQSGVEIIFNKRREMYINWVFLEIFFSGNNFQWK